MGLGRRRKSARDHLACVTVSLECLSLFQASQILESGRKIDDSLPASSPIWASEASRARTSERASERASGVLARLASLAQIGELARRLN